MLKKTDFAATAYVKVQETGFKLANTFACADDTGNVILCAQETLGNLEGAMKAPFKTFELKLRSLKKATEGSAGDVVFYTEEEK